MAREALIAQWDEQSFEAVEDARRRGEVDDADRGRREDRENLGVVEGLDCPVKAIDLGERFEIGAPGENPRGGEFARGVASAT